MELEAHFSSPNMWHTSRNILIQVCLTPQFSWWNMWNFLLEIGDVALLASHGSAEVRVSGWFVDWHGSKLRT